MKIIDTNLNIEYTEEWFSTSFPPSVDSIYLLRLGWCHFLVVERFINTYKLL